MSTSHESSCILYRNICILYRNVYIPHMQYTYTLQVGISTSGRVVRYIGWASQSPSPQEIHCFKRAFHVPLAQHFSECNPGITWDLLLSLFFNTIPEHIGTSVPHWHEFKHSIMEEIRLLHSQPFIESLLLPYHCETGNHPSVDSAAC
jgi:hypothetical protein